MDWSLPSFSVHGISQARIRVDCHFFPAQGSDSRLLHCRQILCPWATWEAQSGIYSAKYCLHTCGCCCSCSVTNLSNSLRPHGLQQARLPCPSLSPGVCWDWCLLSQWCDLTISSSAAPFSFCLPSFPASVSFSVSWLFTSGGQSIAVSTSASVLPMNIQGWFPLVLTGYLKVTQYGNSAILQFLIVLIVKKKKKRLGDIWGAFSDFSFGTFNKQNQNQ